MNQRQKKKTSQQRKRYFDGVKAKEAHSSGAQKKQSSKDHQSKPHPPTTEQLSNKVHGGDAVPSVSKEKDSNILTQDQRKTFSKRKIVSNWAKYDEERIEDLDSTLQQQESEEALQDRLLQLLNLPLTHTTPSLADIGGEEENSGSGTTQQQLRESSKFLTLDCIALAEALSSLPLHERLDIDPKLLLEADTGEAEIGSQSDIDSFELTSTSFHTATREGVDSLRDGGKAGVLDLTPTLKRIAVANGTEEETTIDFSSIKASTQASSFSRQLPGFSGTKLLPSSIDEEAEELDKLLNKSESKPHNGKLSHSHQQSEEEDRSTRSTDRVAKSHPPSTVTVAVNETPELDDMLDELLA